MFLRKLRGWKEMPSQNLVDYPSLTVVMFCPTDLQVVCKADTKAIEITGWQKSDHERQPPDLLLGETYPAIIFPCETDLEYAEGKIVQQTLRAGMRPRYSPHRRAHRQLTLTVPLALPLCLKFVQS